MNTRKPKSISLDEDELFTVPDEIFRELGGKLADMLGVYRRICRDPSQSEALQRCTHRMQVSQSGTDRLAAVYLQLLRENRFHVRSAWWRLCGPRLPLELQDAAEAWAYEAMRRWLRYWTHENL